MEESQILTNQKLEARKHCFLASYLSQFVTPPQKHLSISFDEKWSQILP